MELHINHLPDDNLFRVLLGRERYNDNGVLKYGFTGVFCVKSGFWRSHIKQDIDELKNEIKYDRIIILNNPHNYHNQQQVMCFPELLKSQNRLQKYGGSERIFLPAELVGIASVPCSRKISIVLLTEDPHPKIWMNADFIYLEELTEIPKWVAEYNINVNVKPLKVGGYDENYVVDGDGIKLKPINVQDMGTID
jgi:hypothetical protein